MRNHRIHGFGPLQQGRIHYQWHVVPSYSDTHGHRSHAMVAGDDKDRILKVGTGGVIVKQPPDALIGIQVTTEDVKILQNIVTLIIRKGWRLFNHLSCLFLILLNVVNEERLMGR